MSLYQEDLAFVQTVGFSDFAAKASPALVEALRSRPFVPVSYTHLTLPTSDLV